MNVNFSELDKIQMLVDLKNSDPEKYRKTLMDYKEIIIDLLNLLKEVGEAVDGQIQ